MYTLIGGKASRTFRAMWMLEELGQEWTSEPSKPRTDRVMALNNLGKIPVLLDGETAISDSTAIMTYLADKHGGCTARAGTLERARQDAMTFAILDDIDAVLWTAARHSFILPEEHRVPEIKESLKWEYERNLDRIMERARGPFLMGDDFTLPDIILAHCLGWAKNAKFPSEHQSAREYLKRCRARDAFQKLVAED